MRFRLIVSGFVLGVGAALLSTQAISQNAPPQPPPTAPPADPAPAEPVAPQADPQTPPQQDQPPVNPELVQLQVNQMLEAMGPGLPHKALEPSIGTWDTTTRIWLRGPDQPPVERAGTAQRKWVLDGRFVQEELNTEFPISEVTQGMARDIAWQGLGLMGFDNFRKVYTGCWADTMGTHLLTMQGNVNPEGNTFTFYGKMDEPSIPVVGRMVKYVLKLDDKDNMTFTIYDLHAGENFRAAEVVYKRKQ